MIWSAKPVNALTKRHVVNLAGHNQRRWEARMAPDISAIAVVHYADGWRIVAGRHRWGRYAYRVDAEEAALKLAGRAKRHGRVLKVFVQGRHGRLEQLVAAY